jgi:hypothetical protein
MKLNVGLSKKVTDGNYGSRGAIVNLELELESALVAEPAKLQEKIRQIFAHVRSSLNEELNVNGNGHPPSSEKNGQSRTSLPSNGNGHERNATSGNGNGTSRNGNQRQATQSQVKAIYAIAKNQNIDVNQFLSQRFQVSSPSALTIKEASNVIDELKGNTNNGNGG